MKYAYTATLFITLSCISIAHTPKNVFENNIQAFLLATDTASNHDTKTLSILQKMCGQEIILYPIALFAAQNIPMTLIVKAQEKEAIQDLVTQRFNTAHITIKTIAVPTDIVHIVGQALTQPQEYIILMRANLPLVNNALLSQAFRQHHIHNAMFTTVAADTADEDVHKENIITPMQSESDKTINADGQSNPILDCNEFDLNFGSETASGVGICIINKSFLAHVIAQEKKETTPRSWFSLLMRAAHLANKKTVHLKAPRDSMLSVNTPRELCQATQIQRYTLIEYWMDHDVFFSDPDTVHLDTNVSIGAQSTIGSNVHLTGNTMIGTQCQIHNFCQLHDTTVADNAKIFSHCILNQASVGEYTEVGPFAHLHAAVTVADHSAIGNFVEIQQSDVGAYTKARHLTYLGHAKVGNRVNFGAGTITCNYDGRNKNTTTIEDNIFIGSNNTLVAPITIGKGSFTAAGSVITDSIPENTFAIGRARQMNKLEYAQKMREKVQQKNRQK